MADGIVANEFKNTTALTGIFTKEAPNPTGAIEHDETTTGGLTTGADAIDEDVFAEKCNNVTIATVKVPFDASVVRTCRG